LVCAGVGRRDSPQEGFGDCIVSWPCMACVGHTAGVSLCSKNLANANFVSSSQEEDDWKIGTSDPAPCILEGYGGCVCPEARLHHCNNSECEGHGLLHSVCIGAFQQRFLALHAHKISLAQTGLPEDVLRVVNNIDGKCPCHWLPVCMRLRVSVRL